MQRTACIDKDYIGLQAELAAAKDDDQRVVVFCHQPLHPDSCTGTTLVWTYAEVRQPSHT